MRSICVLCVAIGVSLSATAASARGGMGGAWVPRTNP